MKKRFFATIVSLLLVAMLSVSLVACGSAEDYKKKLEKEDYLVTVYEGDDSKGKAGDYDVEFVVIGTKAGLTTGLNGVTIVKFKNGEDAKKAYDEATKESEKIKDYEVVKKGKIVIAGTSAAVKVVK